MKKSLVGLLHVGFWGCYLILIMVMLGMYFREATDIDARIGNAFQIIFLFILVPATITFYAFYFLLFPKYIKQDKFIPAIIYGVLISVVAATIGYFFLDTFVGAQCIGEESLRSQIELILFMSFFASIAGVVALVIRGFLTWVEEIKLKEALKQKNNEMEMALLKAQLDPHFLFNTINNIDILILKNADKASNYLNKLSEIMRFMLYETKVEKILLSKEIEYIEKYIELQKIRTANEAYVNFKLSGNASNKMIPPMIFIPFIENAFKHTNNKKVANAIEINLTIKAESITFECNNKFDSNRIVQTEKNGLGNNLIQKRLHLIYPEKHNLDVVNQDGLYRVHLTIYDEKI